jgi:hypothetical protein
LKVLIVVIGFGKTHGLAGPGSANVSRLGMWRDRQQGFATLNQTRQGKSRRNCY